MMLREGKGGGVATKNVSVLPTIPEIDPFCPEMPR